MYPGAVRDCGAKPMPHRKHLHNYAKERDQQQDDVRFAFGCLLNGISFAACSNPHDPLSSRELPRSSCGRTECEADEVVLLRRRVAQLEVRPIWAGLGLRTQAHAACSLTLALVSTKVDS